MIRTVRRNDAASFCACSKGTTMNKRLATLCACGFALGLWNNLAYADDGVEVHLPRVEHDWMTAREMATTTRAMGLANNMSTSASGTSAIYHIPAAIASAMMYAIDAAYYYDNADSGHAGQINIVDMKSNSYVGAGLGVHYQYAAPNDHSRHYVSTRLALAVPLAGNILSLGVSAVYNYMKYNGDKVVSQFTMDTGLVVRPLDWISLGLSVQNLIVGNHEDWMPRMITAGVAVGSLDWGVSVMFDASFNLSANEIAKTGSYGAGIEYALKNIVPIRLGYRYEESNHHVIAAGLGYRHDSGMIGVDLAYQHHFGFENDLFSAALSLYF